MVNSYRKESVDREGKMEVTGNPKVITKYKLEKDVSEAQGNDK